LILWKSN